jgi:S-formylglutathione hydrolase FrmB
MEPLSPKEKTAVRPDLKFYSKRNLLVLAVIAVIVLAAVLFLRPRQKPPQPIVDHPRLVPGVAVPDVHFFSPALKREMVYRVFLPANPGDKKLPVIYLLHGGGGTFRDWSNYTDVAQLGTGLLLVMPQGDDSYYVNAAERPDDRYEDYIVNDLRADVAQRFPARSDREGRAIIGISMGGFGAINLAFHHPDQFIFVGGISPAIDVPRRPFSLRRFGQSRRYRVLFGPSGSESRHKNDPFFEVRTADPARLPYFYLSCGQQEGLLAPNREFAALLDRHGIKHEFHSLPGGHDWNRWSAELPGVFSELRKHLGMQ